MDGIMPVMRRWAAVGCGLGAAFAFACGPAVSDGGQQPEGTSSSTGGTTTGTAASTQGGSEATSVASTSTGTAPSGSSSTGVDGKECPAAERGADAEARVFWDTKEWGPHELECDATGWSVVDDRTQARELQLSCVPVEGGQKTAARLVVTTDSIDDQLDAWAEQTGMRLSFWHEYPAEAGSGRFSLRSANGDLQIISMGDRYSEGDGTVLPEYEISSGWWLGGDPVAYDAWNDPFGSVYLRSQDCAERPSSREGVALEEPWALEFESDDGPQRLYDQSVASVTIDGTAFSVFVSAAYLATFRADHRSSSAVVRYLIVPELQE